MRISRCLLAGLGVALWSARDRPIHPAACAELPSAAAQRPAAAIGRGPRLSLPSLAKSRSSARAELLELALAHELGAPVSIQITADYKELETRALAGDAHLIWALAGVCAQLEPITRAIYKAVRQGGSTYQSALVVPPTLRSIARSCG